MLQEDNLDPGVLTDHQSSKNGKSVESFPIESKQLFSRRNCGIPESAKFIKCLLNGLRFLCCLMSQRGPVAKRTLIKFSRSLDT
jgi:hypothetical protein